MEGALGLSVTGVIMSSIALMDLMKPTAMVGSVCLCHVCVCVCVWGGGGVCVCVHSLAIDATGYGRFVAWGWLLAM